MSKHTHTKSDSLSIMSNLQPNCCLKFDFQKVDQHAGGKWLIQDTKSRKDNQLQSLKLPCRIWWWTGGWRWWKWMNLSLWKNEQIKPSANMGNEDHMILATTWMTDPPIFCPLWRENGTISPQMGKIGNNAPPPPPTPPPPPAPKYIGQIGNNPSPPPSSPLPPPSSPVPPQKWAK